jgi:hypothetical protein
LIADTLPILEVLRRFVLEWFCHPPITQAVATVDLGWLQNPEPHGQTLSRNEILLTTELLPVWLPKLDGVCELNEMVGCKV